MIVSIRDLEPSGRFIKAIYVKDKPFDVLITIGGKTYRISEGEGMVFQINVDGQLIIEPIHSNTVKMRTENKHGIL